MRAAAVQTALATNDIGTLAVGVIIGLVVIGLILALVMNKVIGRVVLAVVVIGLGVLVWTQRNSLEDRVHKCDTNATFFGFHVNLSADAQKRCGALNQ